MQKKSNVVGIIGFVLSILSLLSVCISGLIGIVLGIVGLVLSCVGMSKKYNLKGLAIAGLVVSIIGIVISIVAFLLEPADTSSGTISNSDTEIASETDQEPVDNTASLSDSDFGIEELSYSNDYSTSFVLVITNNSGKTVDINATGKAKDENGNALSVTSDDIYGLEPNGSFPLEFYFDETGVSSFEYNLNYSVSNTKSRLDDLSFNYTINNENVIIDCTNNSGSDCEFPKAYVLFYNGDTLVGCNFTYLNNAGVLKANSSDSSEVDCYDTFDNVRVFYNAH